MPDLRALLVDAMRKYSLGGAGIAVVRAGEEPELVCEGLADAGTNRAVDADTVFRIASISKTMTAVALVQLRDRGLLGLDDPVNDHLRNLRVEVPVGAPAVTARHLLTHTAGIGELPRVTDAPNRAMWGAGPPRGEPDDVATLYGGTLRTETPAGAKWAYANHGFAVLGKLVEDVGGQGFDACTREHLFDPLAMDRTESRRSDRTDDRIAVAYHWVLGRLRTIDDYDVSILGAGSVLSSLADMARYAQWLLHGGSGPRGNVLRAESLAEMTTPQYRVDPRLAAIGLAFFLDDLGGHRVFGHDGNNPGFASSLLVAPDDGVGVVVLTNTASFVGTHALATTVLRELLDVDDPVAVLARSTVADRPHSWAELTGSYAPKPGFLTNVRPWQFTGGEVEVRVRRRTLEIRPLWPMPAVRRGLALRPTSPDDPLAFATTIESFVLPVVFARDANGRIESVAIGPPLNTTFFRRSILRSIRLRFRLGAAIALGAALRRASRRRQARRPTR
jgi:CubicO group peptidase (beta-lactamase class C family)